MSASCQIRWNAERNRQTETRVASGSQTNRRGPVGVLGEMVIRQKSRPRDRIAFAHISLHNFLGDVHGEPDGENHSY